MRSSILNFEHRLNILTNEETEYPPQEPARFPRPVEASRVNIVGSPFNIVISDHLPPAASNQRMRAHRPAAQNDAALNLKPGK